MLKREEIRSAREEGGCAAFKEATAVWAVPLGVKAGASAYLSDLESEPRAMVELVE